MHVAVRSVHVERCVNVTYSLHNYIYLKFVLSSIFTAHGEVTWFTFKQCRIHACALIPLPWLPKQNSFYISQSQIAFYLLHSKGVSMYRLYMELDTILKSALCSDIPYREISMSALLCGLKPYTMSHVPATPMYYKYTTI